MKTKFVAVLFAAGAFIIYSCSADYLNNTATANLTTITITADTEANTIGIDQTITLSVLGNDGEDYTLESILYENGVEITENIVQFSEGGVYEFTATYGDLSSNILTIEVVSEKYMTVNKEKLLRGQDVTFNLYEINGDDVTQEATFFVNGSPVAGNTYNSTVPAMYEVYAEYDDGVNLVQTEIQSFEVFIPKRKVSYEDYTGAWCGWCVRVTTAVQMLKEQSDDVVILAIHNNDDMTFAGELQLRNHFEVSGFPAAKINRTITAPNPEDGIESINFALANAGMETDLTIAIQTQLSGNNLSVAVDIMSENTIPTTHKIVVYVYQNNLIFPQANYYNTLASSPWFQMGNPIEDFVHNDVLEASLTSIFGDPIQATNALETYSRSFDAIDLANFAYTEGPNSFNPLNFGIAVFVVDENDNTLNAQHVKAGESVGFE